MVVLAGEDDLAFVHDLVAGFLWLVATDEKVNVEHLAHRVEAGFGLVSSPDEGVGGAC